MNGIEALINTLLYGFFLASFIYYLKKIKKKKNKV